MKQLDEVKINDLIMVLVMKDEMKLMRMDLDWMTMMKLVLVKAMNVV